MNKAVIILLLSSITFAQDQMNIEDSEELLASLLRNPVDLNTASDDEIRSISLISRAEAENIIKARSKKDFESAEEVKLYLEESDADLIPGIFQVRRLEAGEKKIYASQISAADYSFIDKADTRLQSAKTILRAAPSGQFKFGLVFNHKPGNIDLFYSSRGYAQWFGRGLFRQAAAGTLKVRAAGSLVFDTQGRNSSESVSISSYFAPDESSSTYPFWGAASEWGRGRWRMIIYTGKISWPASFDYSSGAEGNKKAVSIQEYYSGAESLSEISNSSKLSAVCSGGGSEWALGRYGAVTIDSAAVVLNSVFERAGYWQARRWVNSSAGFSYKNQSRSLQTLLSYTFQKNKKTPVSALLSLREGGKEWGTALTYLFRSGSIPDLLSGKMTAFSRGEESSIRSKIWKQFRGKRRIESSYSLALQDKTAVAQYLHVLYRKRYLNRNYSEIYAGSDGNTSISMRSIVLRSQLGNKKIRALFTAGTRLHKDFKNSGYYESAGVQNLWSPNFSTHLSVKLLQPGKESLRYSAVESGKFYMIEYFKKKGGALACGLLWSRGKSALRISSAVTAGRKMKTQFTAASAVEMTW